MRRRAARSSATIKFRAAHAHGRIVLHAIDATRASDSLVDLRTGTKQAEGFDAASNEFGGVTVVGIRNDKGVKDSFADKYAQQFYVDVDDEIRNEIGIPKDLFVLGGRETYVVDKDGTVVICA